MNEYRAVFDELGRLIYLVKSPQAGRELERRGWKVFQIGSLDELQTMIVVNQPSKTYV